MSRALIELLEPALQNMLGAGRLSPESYAQLTSIISQKSQEWVEEMADELKQKAKDWESVMPEEKEGFYSLAMRRSADFITGRSELDDS